MFLLKICFVYIDKFKFLCKPTLFQVYIYFSLWTNNIVAFTIWQNLIQLCFPFRQTKSTSDLVQSNSPIDYLLKRIQTKPNNDSYTIYCHPNSWRIHEHTQCQTKSKTHLCGVSNTCHQWWWICIMLNNPYPPYKILPQYMHKRAIF